MKTIFDKETPRCKFESWMQKRQSEVMITGLILFAWIFIRLVFNF